MKKSQDRGINLRIIMNQERFGHFHVTEEESGTSFQTDSTPYEYYEPGSLGKESTPQSKAQDSSIEPDKLAADLSDA